jgi:hypothetical protein
MLELEACTSDETKAHGKDILNDPALRLPEGAVAAAAAVAAKGVTAVHAAAAAIAMMLRNPATQQARERSRFGAVAGRKVGVKGKGKRER